MSDTTVKVTVKPDGAIVIDTNGHDYAQIAALVNALTNTPPVVQTAKDAEPEPGLGGVLAQTYLWLREQDSVTPDEMAEGMGLTKSTANWRLLELVKTGHAEKVSRGVYRAIR